MNDLTYQEKLYMVAALNGVRCQPETFIANIAEAFDYPQGVKKPDEEILIAKLKAMGIEEISELLNKIEKFWNAPDYYIPDTDIRMAQIGLVSYKEIGG